jgi:hypothetical protein
LLPKLASLLPPLSNWAMPSSRSKTLLLAISNVPSTAMRPSGRTAKASKCCRYALAAGSAGVTMPTPAPKPKSSAPDVVRRAMNGRSTSVSALQLPITTMVSSGAIAASVARQLSFGSRKLRMVLQPSVSKLLSRPPLAVSRQTRAGNGPASPLADCSAPKTIGLPSFWMTAPSSASDSTCGINVAGSSVRLRPSAPGPKPVSGWPAASVRAMKSALRAAGSSPNIQMRPEAGKLATARICTVSDSR